MNVFICGLPKAGKTTVAQQLTKCDFSPQGLDWFYINPVDWLKNTFRVPASKEEKAHFNEAYHSYVLNRFKNNPNVIIDNLCDSVNCIKQLDGEYNWIIDGIFSPRDFCALFNYNEDIVVFLNRTDGEIDAYDYETIGISVMRDYCFWLSSANMLPKTRWLEFNFKVSAERSDSVKVLGSKNTVFIVKSIDSVTDLLVKQIQILSSSS